MSLLLLYPVAIPAHEGLYSLCPLLLHEQQVELDGLELAVQLAQTQLEFSETLFVLLDGLWRNDSVEDLAYLQGKHHRDRARVESERTRRLVERQQALAQQYRLVCSADADRGLELDERRALEEAYRRYREADCEVRALDVAVVEVDLVHHRENLASVLDLHRNDVASRQQVILVERDVELMAAQLLQAKQRVARCQRAIAKQWGERPE